MAEIGIHFIHIGLIAMIALIVITIFHHASLKALILGSAVMDKYNS